MWIKRFFDNVNEATEKEDKLILTRRSFFFLSAAAAGAAIVAPALPKVVPTEVVDGLAMPLIQLPAEIAYAFEFDEPRRAWEWTEWKERPLVTTQDPEIQRLLKQFA